MDPIVSMGCTASRKFKSFKGLKKLALCTNLAAHFSVGATVNTDYVHTLMQPRTYISGHTLYEGCKLKHPQGPEKTQSGR